MKRLLISIPLFVLMFFSATVLVFYVQRDSRPTVLCGSLDDRIRPHDHCLMNPFRDARPDATAEEILRGLKNENFDILFPYLDEKARNRVLADKKKYNVEQWWLGDRHDFENRVELTYWATRKDYHDGETGSVHFSFERDGTEWKLKGFGLID